MDIKELQRVYAAHPNVKGWAELMKKKEVKTVFWSGLHASAVSLFASVLVAQENRSFVFILDDMEAAGYFYHDLMQVGSGKVLFFPSSYRRAVKYGQKDAANEVLRTEVLSCLQKGERITVVTYPEALAEQVVSLQEMDRKTLMLEVGQQIETDVVLRTLTDFGFERVDYVYEPGQFALRGSILDIFSFASEFPYRVDFFGEEIDSIRTFEVESQLSKERLEQIAVVPELHATDTDAVNFLHFLPEDTILAFHDLLWVKDRIQAVHDEAMARRRCSACGGAA